MLRLAQATSTKHGSVSAGPCLAVSETFLFAQHEAGTEFLPLPVDVTSRLHRCFYTAPGTNYTSSTSIAWSRMCSPQPAGPRLNRSQEQREVGGAVCASARCKHAPFSRTLSLLGLTGVWRPPNRRHYHSEGCRPQQCRPCGLQREWRAPVTAPLAASTLGITSSVGRQSAHVRHVLDTPRSRSVQNPGSDLTLTGLHAIRWLARL